MPIIEIGEEIAIVRLTFGASEIRLLMRKHDEQYPETKACEIAGVELIQCDFEPKQTVEFVKSVCRWGNGHRLIGRVVGKTNPDQFSQILKESVAAVDEGRVAEAVTHIVKNIPYLGQSFASKQLRFLRPEKVVILDSVIRNSLGYRETESGYQEFLGDCLTARNIVEKSERSETVIPIKLRVCDIERAIFMKLRRL